MPLSHADRVGPQTRAKAAIAETGYTIRALARDYDLEHENLCAMLNGRLTVSERYRDAIEAATGRSVRELFNERLWANTYWCRREARAAEAALRGGGGDA